MNKILSSPLPLRPTNLRSLNLATWFFMTAVKFLSSPQQFSSLPALMVTIVPSVTSSREMTLNATGRDLFDLQWDGNELHMMAGLPVVTKSPWNLLADSWIALRVSTPKGLSRKCILLIPARNPVEKSSITFYQFKFLCANIDLVNTIDHCFCVLYALLSHSNK